MRLRGPRLLVARTSWLLIGVSTFVLYIVNLPAYYASLHVLHRISASPSAFRGHLTPQDVQALSAWGLSLDFYAVTMVVVSLVFQLSYVVVAVLIFARRSEDRVALLASFALLMLPFGYAPLTLQALPPAWTWIITALVSLSNVAIVLCAYVFPDGRFVPSWTRWLALALFLYWMRNFIPFWSMPSQLDESIFILFILSTMLAQLYRYRYVSNAHQRQQTKWVVYGAALTVLGNVGSRMLTAWALVPLFPGSGLVGAAQVILVSCSMLILPPTLGTAILRSHLWDIDVIIHRSLVYSLLTVSLGLLYAALVIGLQALLQGFTGGNQVALVGSTLAMAAAFQPFRGRIQYIIDRRFYRRKYDAAQALAAFSATLRNEVELHDLCEQLKAVVQETMQPSHISLWLRSPVEREEER